MNEGKTHTVVPMSIVRYYNYNYYFTEGFDSLHWDMLGGGDEEKRGVEAGWQSVDVRSISWLVMYFEWKDGVRIPDPHRRIVGGEVGNADDRSAHCRSR